MKFNHAVKHDGVFYPAGAEVPVGNAPKVEEKKPEPVETKTEPAPKPQPKRKRK